MLRLPARRYPEVAGEIQEICERYGLSYDTGRLGRQLGSVAKKICRMALPNRRTPGSPVETVDQTPVAA